MALSEALHDLDTLLQSCGPHRLLNALTGTGHGWLEASWTPNGNIPYRHDATGRPFLVPGTVTQEAAVQAGEALIYLHRGTMAPEDGIPVLARAKNVSFRGPVLRDDEVTIRVELNAELGPAYYIRASAKTGRGSVLAAELTFTATTKVPGLQVASSA